MSKPPFADASPLVAVFDNDELGVGGPPPHRREGGPKLRPLRMANRHEFPAIDLNTFSRLLGVIP